MVVVVVVVGVGVGVGVVVGVVVGFVVVVDYNFRFLCWWGQNICITRLK